MDADLLSRAACGDADAQAGMVDATLRLVIAGETAFGEGVRAAEWWARLAAVHGRPKDLMSLASVLMYAAQVAVDEGEDRRSIAYQAEAILVLNGLADDGDEEAGMFLQQTADLLPPESTLLAANVERFVRAADCEEGSR